MYLLAATSAAELLQSVLNALYVAVGLGLVIFFHELGHFAEVSGAVGLVIPDVIAGFNYRDLAAELLSEHPRLRHILVDGEPGSFQSWSALKDFENPGPPDITVDTSGPAVLLVSGGTTGLPKLIPRTHDDYLYNAAACAQACEMVHDDVYLAVLPAGHNFPFACPGLLGSMTVGATTVYTDDPSPESAFALINTHGVTVTGLVNALAKLWAQACEWEPVLPTSLRVVQVGGSRMSPEEARFIREGLSPGLQQIFGMAEGMLNFTRPGDPVDVVENTQFSKDYLDPEKRSIGNAVQVFFNDGTKTDNVVVEYPIGHRRRRKEGIPVLVEKFERNLATRLSAKRAQQIQAICGAQKTLEQTPVPEFMDLFVV